MYDKGIQILVADDMLTMRKLVTKALRDIGFTSFVEAADGQKAWEVLSQPDCQVKLVISDWNMPNCSGLDLLKRVRKDSRLKELPFLLLTAESEQSQVVEAITAGVDSYVTKPFAADVLLKKIEEVYKKKNAA
jgi:two-component system chemotaxis response regulator CheY